VPENASKSVKSRNSVKSYTRSSAKFSANVMSATKQKLAMRMNAVMTRSVVMMMNDVSKRSAMRMRGAMMMKGAMMMSAGSLRRRGSSTMYESLRMSAVSRIDMMIDGDLLHL
jgi:hypothetical protein